MTTVRLEHPGSDFNGWKKVFDNDPVGREKSGVRRYRIFRPVDDPNYVMVDLEFDGSSKAEAFRVALRELWSGVEGQIMQNLQVRIVETVESKEY